MATTVTVDQVKKMSIDGSFEDVPEHIITDIIPEADSLVAEESWGDDYDRGVKLMAAHMVEDALAGATSAAGPLASERAGGLAHSFQQIKADGLGGLDAWLAKTTYGRRFMHLRETLEISPTTTFCGV